MESTDYAHLFSRNRGVLSRDEQERLRRSRVLIVGCGGVGGTVATILARSGVGGFSLVDPDRYEPTNANRQIACFDHTWGRNKAEVIGETLRAINPLVETRVRETVIPVEEIDEWLRDCDLVFPAADDYAYSITVFRRARALGKPALLVVPAGLWAIVTLFEPGGPTLEHLHGVPPIAEYEALHAQLEKQESRYAAFFYRTLGGFERDYFTDYVENGAPVAQICPAVWLASSLGAYEVTKRLSGVAQPVSAPRYWMLSRRGRVNLEHMARPSVYNALAWYRRVAWRVMQSPVGGMQRKAQDLFWEFLKRVP